MKEITSLLYYLIRRCQRENEVCLLKKVFITIHFPHNLEIIELKDHFKVNDEKPLTSIKKFIRETKNVGYFFLHLLNISLFKLDLKPKNRKPKKNYESG